jgi:hypothetical protein
MPADFSSAVNDETGERGGLRTRRGQEIGTMDAHLAEDVDWQYDHRLDPLGPCHRWRLALV